MWSQRACEGLREICRTTHTHILLFPAPAPPPPPSCRFPIGKLLDFMLPRDTHVLFRRKELKALVDMHGADEGLGGKLSDDEVQIITGARVEP